MYAKYFKRLIDLSIGICAFPFVLLVIIICTPLIYFTDRGPVFYNASRAGKGYKPFKMFKLRSMYKNSQDIRNSDGSTFNSDNDPRVTPIGRFMRKTSIDEIPQIINVLIGDMSFIGPRPTLYSSERSIDNMDENRKKRYLVRPGITGYAQAYFRNSIGQETKFKLDAYYTDNISFKLDLKILYKTIMSVLRHQNVFVENSK